MTSASFLIVVLSRPWLWIALVALRLWAYNRPGATPPIASRYIKGVHGPGSLCHGGSAKTSGLEGRVRASLTTAGFNVLPASVHLITPLTDKHGNWRKFTPDILVVHRGTRIVVEVDPYHFHGEGRMPTATNDGSNGLDKIYHDVERNYAYSATGWAVVRVRIGWPASHPWRQIGRNDVVIDGDDFFPAEHAERVKHAILHARRVPASSWNKQLAALSEWAKKD